MISTFKKLTRSIQKSLRRRAVVPRHLEEPEPKHPLSSVGENPQGPELLAALEALREAAEGGDIRELESLIQDYRRFVSAVEETFSPPRRGRPGLPLEVGTGIQSKQFMIDLLPYIQEYLTTQKRGRVFRVLDVGSGTGHGANLLASLYAAGELGYKMSVTSLDINSHYERYIQVACRYLAFKKQNVFAIKKPYDIVIASHVVEHVREAKAFCEQLQACATGAVFVAAPYEEPPDKLTSGHVHSLGAEFLDNLETKRVAIVESRAWGNFLSPPYKMFVAELPGRA